MGDSQRRHAHRRRDRAALRDLAPRHRAVARVFARRGLLFRGGERLRAVVQDPLRHAEPRVRSPGHRPDLDLEPRTSVADEERVCALALLLLREVEALQRSEHRVPVPRHGHDGDRALDHVRVCGEALLAPRRHHRRDRARPDAARLLPRTSRVLRRADHGDVARSASTFIGARSGKRSRRSRSRRRRSGGRSFSTRRSSAASSTGSRWTRSTTRGCCPGVFLPHAILTQLRNEIDARTSKQGAISGSRASLVVDG